MGISFWHLLILLVVVLLIFGPQRISGLGKSLGEAIRGFKKGIAGDDEIDVTKSTRNESLTANRTADSVKETKKDTVN
jgi:sec-independent protein translocase protein TatA